ncbi:MAG: putative transcriptional activator SRCAP-like protein, partial [Steroidobacteraceae bacterium]|nr:putative transcriptional activator SRCAP-like protein [Steroidobacteraceae bacterium]
MFADPAGWLRSAGSLAASPLKIQSLLDALRPLMGLDGEAGSPWTLAKGVELAVSADGAGARLALAVKPREWVPPPGGGARLAGEIKASLAVGPVGVPNVACEAHLGLAGASPGRQAVHTRLGNAGIELFVRPASGADIPLVPFSGFGGLSAAAEAALPYLLDKLVELPGTPGELVRTVGDALALRGGAPRTFRIDALRAWAANPVGALTAAVPSITATGLDVIAPLLDDFLPAGVDANGTVTELGVTAGGVTLSWQPAASRVVIAAPSIAVTGIETLGFAFTISAAGLDELSVAVGPARIDTGGVLLRPFASVGAGLAPSGGRRVLVGLSADDTHHFAARWTLDTLSFDLVASDGPLASAIDSTDAAQVALRIVDVVGDLVAAVAMAQQSVQNLLDEKVGGDGKDVRFLLRGVVLDEANDAQLIDGLFDPATLLERVHRLFNNVAGAGIAIELEGLRVGFRADDGTVGLRVGLVERYRLTQGDVSLWLEDDASWIDRNPGVSGGLFDGLLPPTQPFRFTPSLKVEGLGLRVGRDSGPLLDAGITVESVALHVFAAIDAKDGVTGGGVQLQFSDLAVSTAGAGGDNGIAQGIMRDTGPTPPKPAFSPALAVQAHDGGAAQVSLTAGEGTGPWWIAIRKGFGPLYLEQVGFGTATPQGRLERISLLMDGAVSMFGLTCAVDDLQITYFAANEDFFNPSNWQVDLAGLAVSADIAGVSIAGGLLKQTTSQGIEYLGMLLGRFAVYGLTVYGGYGEGEVDGQKFTAFFAIGAVNGPIGGPPAFFLTGIGGGFGINRKLVLPTDLSNFGDYPLIQALDIAATPSDPMTQLRALGSYFPMQKGTFWFAAGLSFNSFALVDGIAAVGVQIGDGLDISLLGLARMALPRPQVALVSIELALLVRFSSREGVLWVQGQLTDNSWLLYPDIKLTGGFAYVIWFKGEKTGEFVLTMGGYHPDFHRDGYPVVPRLGLRWSIGSNIVIKAGGYFALTSEALMAGGDFEASASLGPGWAEVKFGAHGIVFFDPFHYDVMAYARIAAGVTVDTWLFGEVTFSISRGARIHVLGPDFRGSVTFDVGPVELTFEFGGAAQEQRQPIAAHDFIAKYLEAADSGKARPHALMTNTGVLPAKGEQSTPDGSSARPFVVVVEFSMTFASTVPATQVTRTGAGQSSFAPSRALGVAPMEVADVSPTIVITWRRGGADQPYPFVDAARPFGRFPVGVWGLPQDPNA